MCCHFNPARAFRDLSFVDLNCIAARTLPSQWIRYIYIYIYIYSRIRAAGRKSIGLFPAALCVLIAALILVPFAGAVTVSSSGSWSGAGPGTPHCLWYSPDGTQVRYGDNNAQSPCPSDHNLQSGFGFVGVSGVNVPDNSDFVVGTFTHFNRPVYSGSSPMNYVDLNVQIQFDSGPTETFTYRMNLVETPNTGTCSSCPTWGYPDFTCETPCPDLVTIDMSIQDRIITVNGVDYTLQMVGFIPSGTVVDHFITQERKENVAQLVAKLIRVNRIITVEKLVNGQNITSAPGPTIPDGCPVSWTYRVSNPGNVPLSGVTLADDHVTVPAAHTGDVNGNSLLDPGETWTYSASGTATPGQYSNVATAHGTFAGTTVNDTDQSWYYGCSRQVTAPPSLQVNCTSEIPAAASSLHEFNSTGGVIANCGQAVSISHIDVYGNGEGCPQDPQIVTRRYTLSYACGADLNCNQTITVVDVTPPVLVCPSDVTISCSDSSLPENTGFATATDNCGASVNITYNDQVIPGDCPDQRTIARTWRAEDNCGNVATCTQTITVVDTTLPVIVCPSDVTISCSDSSLPENTGFATATDNCDASVNVTYSDQITPGTCPDQRSISRTWRAEDNCGNVATCTQTITVVDTTLPVIVCPSDVTISCSDSHLPENTGFATATDNCDTSVNITYSDFVTPGSCPDQWSISRTWRAEDNCGNVATCTQTITVVDTTLPVIVCPSDVTISCSDSSQPENTGFATATDNCDASVNVTYSDEITPGSCPDQWTIARTWRAEDNCGNVATCTQTITVVDTTLPVIVCPSDVTISCSDSSLPENTGFATATDNCDASVNITYSDEIAPGSCPDQWSIARTWRAEDNCGNVAACTQTITVVDTTQPVIVCPSDVTISCSDSSLPENTGFATASDNCDTSVYITYSDEITPGTCSDQWSIARTWRAEDNCGNVATCTQTITVVDVTPPVLVCPSDVTISCSDSSLPDNTGFATATDNCDARVRSVNITYSDEVTPGSCPDQWSISRTWRAEDNCGNVATCTQTITVVDTTQPVIVCPSDVTISCSDSSLPENTGFATATDNCDPSVNITYSDEITSGTCLDQWSIARTWRAEDNCGNVATCTQTITVIDVVPPVISCPPDLTVGPQDPTDPINTGFATATDNCDASVNVTYSDLVTPGSCPDQWSIARTWRAEDNCGNFATCIQTITVFDGEPPTIICPSDVTISCDESIHPDNTGWAQAEDDSGSPANVTYHDLVTPGSCPDQWSIVRTWRAEDNCGNVATCTQTITVVDTTLPVIVCPSDVTISCSDSSSPENTGFATATDNCDTSVNITYSDEITPGTCPDQWSISRTWRAEDNCGNVATCTQTITVVDTTQPVLVCPSDVTISCSDSDLPENTGFATATDNCDTSVNITYSDEITPGTCPDQRSIARTWRAEDNCGNVATCTQTITAVDTTLPVIVCPSDVTISCSDSSLPENTGFATATDNCDTSVNVTYSDQITPGTCPDQRSISRTWRAEDNCGNVATCIQTITVVDTTLPVIVCPSDVTISCSDSHLPENTGFATATDNCDSSVNITYSDLVTPGSCPDQWSISRTWRAEDNCGNVATCTQTITVVDTTQPVLVCPSDVTISCSDSTLPENTGFATATDNCDTSVNITYSDEITQGSCPDQRSIARTWRAEDSCGNVATCTQTITVVDTTLPVIVCPSDVTISCSDSDLPENTGFATATDNCDTSVNITYSDEITPGTCPDQRSIARTWRAEDRCGNVATCTQTITVVDTTLPVIVCPSDVTISCSDSSLPENTGFATATDNCDTSVNVTYSDQITPGTCPDQRSISRTWRAEDNCGNVATCTQTITVIDVVPPVISCPPDLTVGPQDPTDPGNTGFATATDNCDASVNITYSDLVTPGVCPDQWTIARTWRAEDNCGNFATCTQTITVFDGEPPTIVCPSDVTISCDESIHPDNTGWAQAEDDSGSPANVTYHDLVTPGSCPDQWSIVRTWRAEDNCGNVATCTQTITVVDTTLPVIVCPSDVTISCSDSSLPENTGFATATDNCDTSVTITYSDLVTPGSCPDQRSIARTWRAEDNCGNVATCTQTITVVDTTLPLIVCPSDVTISCSDSTLPENTGFATATDNCDASVNVTYSDLVTPGTCPDQRSIARTWRAEDNCGNVATCTQTITVVDVTPPVLVCPSDVTISCSDSTLPENTGFATATDNCDSSVNVTYSDLVTPGACPDQRSIARTWRAEDNCGNFATCTQTITVVDVVPPVISCPPDLTVGPQDPTDPGNTGFATATDNCDASVAVTYSDLVTPGACPDQWTIARTWRAEDNCGNVATCTQTITVFDGEPPTIICPSDVTVSCDESTHPDNTGWAQAEDDSGSPANVTYHDLVTPGACPDQRSISRKWRAEDNCGNVATCTQTITVVDTTLPVIVCPSDVTISCSDSSLPENTGFATATDNCDASATITYSDLIIPGSCPDQRSIVRTWRAEDNCGNVAICNQTISIEDLTPPVLLNIPANTTVECDSIPDPAAVYAQDACSDSVNLTFSEVRVDGNCSGRYTLFRNWTAIDECGNAAYASQRIDAVDGSGPVIACPSSVEVCNDPDRCDAVVVLYAPKVSDSCGTVASLNANRDDGLGLNDSFSVGTHTVTWTAIDDCGNPSQCRQNVVVRDCQAPEITAPPEFGICADPLTKTAVVTDYGTPTYHENCGGEVSLKATRSDGRLSLQDPWEIGEHTVTWTVTDASGNHNSSVQRIVVHNCIADVDIKKTASPKVVSQGDELVYNLQVINRGPAEAGNVRVTDVLPSELDRSRTTYQVSTGGVELPPQPYPADNVIVLGNMSVGQSATILVKGVIDVGPSVSDHVFYNTACVSRDNWDPDKDDCSADKVRYRKISDVDVEKVGPSQVVVNISEPAPVLTYTLTVTNRGPGDASSIVVRDQLPKEVVFMSAVADNGAPCSYIQSTRTVVCNIGDMLYDPHGSNQVIVTIQVELPWPISMADDGGSMLNRACITHSSSDHDPDRSDCASVITEVIKLGPKLKTQKKADLSSVAAGDQLGFTIEICNEGSSPAEDVLVKDVMSRQFPVIFTDPMPSEDGFWHLGTLDPGQCARIRIVIVIPETETLFDMSNSVSGEGFVNVYGKYDTSEQSYTIKNCAFVSSKANRERSDCATVSVKKKSGTEVVKHTAGSGSYESQDLISYRSKNQSVSVFSSLNSESRPSSFSLPKNRSISVETRWTDRLEARNLATGSSINERYMYMQHLQKESGLHMDQNGSILNSEADFSGAAHIGVLKKSSADAGPKSSPLYEASEDYVGSFRTMERVDEYGSSVVSDRDTEGYGYVSVDRRIGDSQGSRESGTGKYSDPERIATFSNYLSKDLTAVRGPTSFNYSPNLQVEQDIPWSEGMWSKSPATSASGLALGNCSKATGSDGGPCRDNRSTSSISERYWQLERISKSSEFGGLSNMRSNATFTGIGEFQASQRSPNGTMMVDLDERYVGTFNTDREVVLTGVSKYDHPHLTVAKEGSVREVRYRGRNISLADYLVTITNDGDRSLAPVYIRDHFPSGSSFINASARPEYQRPDLANWTIPYLGIGDTITLRVRLNVTDQESSPLINRVYVSGGYHGGWVHAQAYSSLEPNWLSCCRPLVNLEKAAWLDPANPRLVRFRLVASNDGSGPVAATLVDFMPSGLQLVGSTVPISQQRSDSLVWVLGDLGAGQKVVIEYAASALHKGEYINTAQLMAEAIDGSGSSIAEAVAFVHMGDGSAKKTFQYGEWQRPDWDFTASQEGLRL